MSYGQYGFAINATGDALVKMKEIGAEMGELTAESKVTTAEIQTHFTEMGEHIGHTFERLKTIIETAFGAIALFEGYEFFTKSAETFEALEKANAQVAAGLKSTHSISGETMESLKSDQVTFREKVDYSKAAIADMQAQLLTFPGISKKVFPQVEQDVLDMATRLHKGIDETAIMVGKALQDPDHGITALRRVGVDFNKQQTEYVKTLVKVGETAKAQAYILAELETEFGGSAEAAAKANPFFEFDKSVELLEEDLGELIKEIKVHFAPTLMEVANAFKDSIDWMREHKELLLEIGDAVKLLIEGWLILKAAVLGLNIAVFASNALFAAFDTELAVEATAAEGAAVATGGLSTAVGTLQKALGPLIITLTAAVGLYRELKNYAITPDDVSGMLSERDKDILSHSVDVDLETNRYGFRNKKERDTGSYLKTKEQYQAELAEANKAFAPWDAINKAGTIGGANILGHLTNNSPEAQDALVRIARATQKLKDLEEKHAEATKEYKAPGGDAFAKGADNTSAISGASGGLGEAKVIHITINGGLMHIDKVTGVDDVKKLADTAGEQLMREVNNLSLSQSSSF
jgi:hypothetical protein